MTKHTEVGGNILYGTDGNYAMYTKDVIKNHSHAEIAQNGGKVGIKHKEPKKTPEFEEIYSLAIDLAWISMVVMYIDSGVKIGSIYKRIVKAHAFKLLGMKTDDHYGFRCYHFSFKISKKVFNAFVFVGTRSTNFYSLTDNVSQGFRLSEQVRWAQKIGSNTSKLENVIFAGHSKGGREAAHAAIEHGSATVYSYNTSIAYLDDHNKVKKYISKGGAMHHFTVTGEILMMNKANGWNAGFKPTIVYGDDVIMRSVMYTAYDSYGQVTGRYPTSYYCRPDEKTIDIVEQVKRHSDYPLMLRGLEKAKIMSPSTMRYFR